MTVEVRQKDPQPAPVRPTLVSTEVPSSSTFYERNTREVKQKLKRFGFGPTVEFITPEGIHQQQYTSWARGKLLGPAYKNGIEGKQLPETIGEVPIPENVRKHAPDVAALLMSVNLGYGHLRVAKALQQTIDVLGGETHNLFLGGDTDVINTLKPKQHLNEYGKVPPKGERAIAVIMSLLRRDPNSFVKSVTKIYTEYSLNDAYEKGMIHEKPTHEKRTLYDKWVARVVGFPALLEHKPLSPEFWKKLEAFRTNPDALVADFFSIKDTQTPKVIAMGRMALRTAFLKNFVEMIKQVENKTTKKELLIIATHFAIANVVGDLPRDVMETLPLPYQTAHFQPDALMIHAGYMANPPTYVEREETAQKWGYNEGLEGPNDAVVLHGYLSPLSVFERNMLSKQRSDAIKRGEPLNIIAPASGVNPAQLGAFKAFMKDHKEEINNGSMHMVIQCGNEKAGGILTYDELKQFVKEQQLHEENILLHVGKTPEAAMDFLEAVTWSPNPVALLVKGAEVARMAQALNIPHIATGALGSGGHEIWNIAMSLLDNPESVVFPQNISETFQKNVSHILPNDIFVRRHQNKEFVSDLITRIQEQTPATPEDLTKRVRAYIASEKQSLSDQAAMLTMLSTMIAKNHPEENAFIPETTHS